MRRIRPTLAVLATLAAVLAVLGVAQLGGGSDRVPPSGEPPPGAVLSADDRLALDARPVDRGAPPPATDPDVDPTDPVAVARAYLSAAHSARPDDAGRTNLRAAAYAAPGSPPADVGVLVLDPPPAGAERTASVTALDLVAVAHGEGAGHGHGTDEDPVLRRGYRAEIETTTGPRGGPVATEHLVRHVVLARQPDDTWLVAAESTAAPDLSAGEHRLEPR
ncbi:hypothetical protein [Pseudonocardia humida]|uniref:Mce-associated membrane protein n=1 Tax=Pseudonocardia humida TaxID=2800819 RepID=A0ABT1A2M6_9PSEU|nr:hypothetical protein [Pseudonocardia humida]MCO1657248.1 hypothetical protein [Pseudonocardia humida]